MDVVRVIVSFVRYRLACYACCGHWYEALCARGRPQAPPGVTLLPSKEHVFDIPFRTGPLHDMGSYEEGPWGRRTLLRLRDAFNRPHTPRIQLHHVRLHGCNPASSKPLLVTGRMPLPSALVWLQRVWDQGYTDTMLTAKQKERCKSPIKVWEEAGWWGITAQARCDGRITAETTPGSDSFRPVDLAWLLQMLTSPQRGVDARVVLELDSVFVDHQHRTHHPTLVVLELQMQAHRRYSFAQKAVVANTLQPWASLPL